MLRHSGSAVSVHPSLWRRIANLRAVMDLPAALRDLQRSGAPTSRIDIGPYPLAYVGDIDSVRAVLDGRVAGVAERGRFFEEISRVIGPTSLISCEGDDHRRLRRLLAPAFRPDQAADYASTMVEATGAGPSSGRFSVYTPRRGSRAAKPLSRPLSTGARSPKGPCLS